MAASSNKIRVRTPGGQEADINPAKWDKFLEKYPGSQKVEKKKEPTPSVKQPTGGVSSTGSVQTQPTGGSKVSPAGEIKSDNPNVRVKFNSKAVNVPEKGFFEGVSAAVYDWWNETESNLEPQDVDYIITELGNQAKSKVGYQQNFFKGYNVNTDFANKFLIENSKKISYLNGTPLSEQDIEKLTQRWNEYLGNQAAIKPAKVTDITRSLYKEQLKVNNPDLYEKTYSSEGKSEKGRQLKWEESSIYGKYFDEDVLKSMTESEKNAVGAYLLENKGEVQKIERFKSGTVPKQLQNDIIQKALYKSAEEGAGRYQVYKDQGDIAKLDRLKSLEGEIAKTSAKLNILQNQINENNFGNDGLTEDQQKGLNELKAQYQVLKTDYDNQNTDFESLKSEVEPVFNQLKKLEEAISNDSEFVKLKTKLEPVFKELEALKGLADQGNSEAVIRFNQLLDYYQKDISVYNQKANQQKAIVTEYKNIYDQNKEKLDLYNERLKAIMALESQVNSRGKEFNKYIEKISGPQAAKLQQYNASVEKYNSLVTQSAPLFEEYRKLMAEIGPNVIEDIVSSTEKIFQYEDFSKRLAREREPSLREQMITAPDGNFMAPNWFLDRTAFPFLAEATKFTMQGIGGAVRLIGELGEVITLKPDDYYSFADFTSDVIQYGLDGSGKYWTDDIMPGLRKSDFNDPITGEFTYSPQSLIVGTFEQVGQIAGAAIGTYGSMGLGMSTNAAVIAPMFFATYDNNKDLAKQLGFQGSEATAAAILFSQIEGVSELIYPDIQFFQGSAKKEAMKMFIENFQKGGTKMAVSRFLTTVGKEISEEYAVELGKYLTTVLTRFATGNNSVYEIDPSQLVETTIFTALAGGMPAAVQAKVTTSKTFNSSMMFEMAKDLESSITMIEQYNDYGKIDNAKAEVLKRNLKVISAVQGQLPKDISHAKRVVISSIYAQKAELQEKLNDSNITAEIKDSYEKAIKKLNDLIAVTMLAPDKEFTQQYNTEMKRESEEISAEVKKEYPDLGVAYSYLDKSKQIQLSETDKLRTEVLDEIFKDSTAQNKADALEQRMNNAEEISMTEINDVLDGLYKQVEMVMDNYFDNEAGQQYAQALLDKIDKIKSYEFATNKETAVITERKAIQTARASLQETASVINLARAPMATATITSEDGTTGTYSIEVGPDGAVTFEQKGAEPIRIGNVNDVNKTASIVETVLNEQGLPQSVSFSITGEDGRKHTITVEAGKKLKPQQLLDLAINIRANELGTVDPADFDEAYEEVTKEVEVGKTYPNMPVLGEMTDEEYFDFLDNGNVSNERIVDIARKVMTNQELTPQENEIFTDKTAEINQVIKTYKPYRNAVQEQAAGQVPVQPEAGTRQEMAEGKPQAEPQVTAQAGVEEEIADIERRRQEELNTIGKGSDGKFYSNDGKKVISGVSEEDVINKLNAKYDAELAALGATPAPTAQAKPQAPAQKVKVQVAPKTRTETVESIRDKAKRANLDKATENVIASWRNANIDVRIIEDEAEYDSIVGTEGTNGIFDDQNGVIYINPSRMKLAQRGNRVLFHESTHPVLNILYNTDKARYDRIMNGMMDAAKKGLPMWQDLQNFRQRYINRGYSEEQADNELMTETFGRIINGEIGLNDIPVGWRQAVVDMLNKIAKLLRLKPIGAVTDAGKFRDFAASLKDAFEKGRDISTIVGAENVKKFQSPFVDINGEQISEEKLQFSLMNDFSNITTGMTFEYLSNNSEFDKIKTDGFITENMVLDDFTDAYVVLHSPDAAFSGTIKKNGNVLIDGKGGIFYPIRFHRDGFMWASTKGGATTLANVLNESAKLNNGRVLMALVSAPRTKLLSSTTMSNAIVDFFTSKIVDNKINIKQSYIINALKKSAKSTIVNNKGEKIGLNISLSGITDLNEVVSKIKTKLSPDNSTFADRKQFVFALLDDISSRIKGTESEQLLGRFLSEEMSFEEYKQQGKKVYNLSRSNLAEALSNMLQEPMLRNEKDSGNIYAIIEIDATKGYKSGSNVVKVIDSKKHESYPKTIAPIDKKNKVRLHILQDRLQWNQVSEDPTTNEIIKSDRELKVFPTSGVSVSPVRIKGQPSLVEGQEFESTINGETVVLKPVDVDVVNGFYSPLEQEVFGSRQDRMPAKKWLDRFKGREEAKWTGLNDWLESQEGVVSKQDILDYMKENRVLISEVVLETKDTAKERFGFSQELELPGEKENYREVLVTLPTKRERATIVEIDGKWRIRHTDGSLSFAKYVSKAWAEKALTEYIETEKEGYRTDKDTFRSSHFDEPNILVHLRMNERTDAEGNKVLFLEEVQSDWAQKGRREGFAQKEQKPKKLEELSRGQLIEMLAWNDPNGIYTDEDSRREGYEPMTKEEALKKVNELIRSEGDAFETERFLRQGSMVEGIPTAPFVMNTSDWVKLAMRVALKEAVKSDANSIAWTTGEQQNDRFDLSKTIDELFYQQLSDGKGNLIDRYYIRGTKNQTRLIEKDNLQASELEQYVGKEVAEKIINGDVEGTLKGIDLKVGGKGMIGFYGDVNKPGIVDQVASKLFGQEVGATEINGVEQPSVKVTPQMKAEVKRGLPQFSLMGERDVAKRLEGIKELFKSNPELASEGTQKEYSQYLDTIFPKVKDIVIVYHGTNEIFDEFSNDKLGGYTKSPSAYLGHFFSSNIINSSNYSSRKIIEKQAAKEYKEYRELLFNLLNEYNSLKKKVSILEYSIKENKLLTQVNTLLGKIVMLINKLLKIGKHNLLNEILIQENKLKELKVLLSNKDIEIQKIETKLQEITNISRFYDDKIGYADSLPNDIIKSVILDTSNVKVYDDNNTGYRAETFYNRILKAKEEGYTSVIIKNTRDPLDVDIYVVFDPEQIHILGDKEDVERFKKWKKEQPLKEKDAIGKPRGQASLMDDPAPIIEQFGRKAESFADAEQALSNGDYVFLSSEMDGIPYIANDIQSLKANYDEVVIVKKEDYPIPSAPKQQVDDINKKIKKSYPKGQASLIEPSILISPATTASIQYPLYQSMLQMGLDAYDNGARDIEMFTSYGKSIQWPTELTRNYHTEMVWGDVMRIKQNKKPYINSEADYRKMLERITKNEKYVNERINEKKNKSWRTAFSEKAFDSKRAFFKALLSQSGELWNVVAAYVHTMGGMTAKSVYEADQFMEATFNGLSETEEYDYNGMKWSERQLIDRIIILEGYLETVRKMQDKFDYFIALESAWINETDPAKKDLLKKNRDEVKDYLERNKVLAGDGKTVPYSLMDFKRSNLTPAKASDLLIKLQAAIPNDVYDNLNKRVDAYFEAFKMLLEKKYNEGLISREAYEEMAEYKYVPTRFIGYLLNDLQQDQAISLSTGTRDQIQRLMGGSEEELLMQNQETLKFATFSLNRSIQRNRASLKLAEAVRANPNNTAFYFPEVSKRDKYGNATEWTYDSKNKGLIKYYVDGKVEAIATDIDVANAYNGVTEEFDMPEALSILFMTTPFRMVTTNFNPGFGLTQIVIDLNQALLASDAYASIIYGAPAVLFRDIKLLSGKALGLASRKMGLPFNLDNEWNELYSEAREYGALISFTREESLDEAISKAAGKKSVYDRLVNGNNPFAKLANTIERVNTSMEYVTRLAVYRKKRNNLIDEYRKNNGGNNPTGTKLDDIRTEAAAAALNILNYNRGGSWVRSFNKAMAYLNVQFQVPYSIVQNFKKSPGLTSLKAAELAVYGALGMGALYSMLDDDDKKWWLRYYNGLSVFEKSNYWHFPNPFRDKDDPDTWLLRFKKPQFLLPLINSTEVLSMNYFTDGKTQGFAEYMKANPLDEYTPSFGRDLYEAQPLKLSMVSSVPSLNMAFIGFWNYDLYRMEKVVRDAENIANPLEGIDDPQVGQFYKYVSQNAFVDDSEYFSDGILSPKRMDRAIKAGIGDYSRNPVTAYPLYLFGSILNSFSGDYKKANERVPPQPEKSILSKLLEGAGLTQRFTTKIPELKGATRKAVQEQKIGKDAIYSALYFDMDKLIEKGEILTKDKVIQWFEDINLNKNKMFTVDEYETLLENAIKYANRNQSIRAVENQYLWLKRFVLVPSSDERSTIWKSETKDYSRDEKIQVLKYMVENELYVLDSNPEFDQMLAEDIESSK